MRLGLDRLWLFLALALPALASLVVALPAVDLAYQLRVGETILRTGEIPATDTMTFTVAGAPWTDQQWLAQVLLGAIHGSGGWELLAVLRAALVAGAFGLVAAAAMARGASPRISAILSLVAFALAAPALALRPQLIGIAIFAALVLVVAHRARHPRALVLAPLLVALWANVHGSFVLAPLLLGYAWLDDLVRGRPSRAAFLVLVAGTLATLLNPFGIGAWSYAVGIGANPGVTAQASEWQRTTPFTVPGLLFYLSAAVALAVAVRGRDRLRWPDWLWLVTLFAVGAWAERGIAWWPLGAMPVVATALGGLDVGPAPARRVNRLNTVVVGMLAVAIVVALPWWRPSDPLTGRRGLLSFAPSGLASALHDQAGAGTRVFAPQPWASWLEWAVPDAGYFVDSRFELFPVDVWRDYETIAGAGAGAPTVLDRWDVDVMVVADDGSGAPGGWTRVYGDEDGALLVRGSR